MWLKDPKKDPNNKDKSATLTFLTIGFIVALIKLLLADLTFGKLTFGSFPASEFAIIISSLGALYAARKYTDKDKE